MFRGDRPGVRRARRGRQLAAVVCATTLTILFASPAGADVTQVSGGAFGYKASVSLFGGPANNAGPAPTVTLPASGATPAITASEPQAQAKFGPAVIFSSKALKVSTEGSLGANGSVTSSADVQNENTSGEEVFTAARVQSSCKASESGPTASTTITGGELVTSEGDPDKEGDETKVTIPTNPAANTEHQGKIETVNDSYRIIFNEQIPQAGGVTVNAVHMVLLGPTAVGDLFVGQAVCAVNAGGGSGGGGGSSSATTTTVRGGAGSGSSGSTSGSGGGGGSNMPKTGFDALPLTVVGSEMVAGGVAAVLWAGRRRRWPRR